ncbi:MAG TPA: hypothetical protein VFC47_04670 [Caulobacteraceae bacterium]|nr:hypothetical protein [Caulobacteraceae bacterium]
MLHLVRLALSRPLTFIVMAVLIVLVGPLAAMRTPTDIFPDIKIPACPGPVRQARHRRQPAAEGPRLDRLAHRQPLSAIWSWKP